MCCNSLVKYFKTETKPWSRQSVAFISHVLSILWTYINGHSNCNTHTHTPRGSSCWWWVHHILLWWSWRCTAPAETHTTTGRWPQSPDDRERGDLRGRALTHTQKYSPRHTHIPSSSPCPPEAALALWSLSEECRWPADGNHLENTHNQS